MAPVPRNRFTMTMMAIILLFYFAWLVLALVVVGPVMMTFLPVLMLPALVVPIVVTHYVPMLMARAVEGLEHALKVEQTSAKTANLQLEAKEKEQIQEVTLVLKASVTQVVCIVVMALPMVQFYRDDQEWDEHALDFLSSTFGIKELSLQFGLSISWPTFEMPEISATYFLGVGILFLTLLRSYATQLLVWCSGQTWFAMSEASPGTWEERAVSAFSYSRCV